MSACGFLIKKSEFAQEGIASTWTNSVVRKETGGVNSRAEWGQERCRQTGSGTPAKVGFIGFRQVHCRWEDRFRQ